MKLFERMAVVGMSLVSSPVWAQVAGGQLAPGDSPNSSGAGSPLTDFTAGAIAYILIIGVLVAVLLGGAFLVLNLGLMSKREEDKIGGRTPSDVGFLQNTNWPETPVEERRLPAADDEEGKAGEEGPGRAA